MDYSSSYRSPVSKRMFPRLPALDLEGPPKSVCHVSDCGFHNLVLLVCYYHSISAQSSSSEAHVGGYSRVPEDSMAYPENEYSRQCWRVRLLG
jgi:hypothetical protein